jgi:hypothetical protein
MIMKQHISSLQLRELSLVDRKLLHKWWKPTEGDIWIDTSERGDIEHHAGRKSSKANNTDQSTSLPFMSIGQMVEFLGDIQLHNDGISWVVISDRRIYMPPDGDSELCDSLWETMKGEIKLLQTQQP